MADATSIGTTIVAVTGLITGVGVAAVQLSKVLADRRLEKEQEAEAPVKRVNLIVDGAEAVVAVLRQDYERVHQEAITLAGEVSKLRLQLQEKDEAIATLREKLASVEAQISMMSKELLRLQGS